MGIGAVAYRMKRRLRGGLTASWYREIVRPRILRTPSILLPQAGACEIHVLTSADDWLNLVWALKTFFFQTKLAAPVWIYEDGSITPEIREQLKTHFVGVQLVSREQADREVIATLDDFPACREFRSTNNLSLKMFNTLHYAQSERIVLLDSDLLFFSRPEELLKAIDSDQTLNRFNRDVDDAYSSPRGELAEAFSLDVATRFNSGLCVLEKSSLQLDWLEEFLSHEALDGHFWRIEQTLFCLCSSRFGTKPLPEEYDVILAAGLAGKPVKHYVGAIREQMYAEGIRKLVAEQFLERFTAEPPVLLTEGALA